MIEWVVKVHASVPRVGSNRIVILLGFNEKTLICREKLHNDPVLLFGKDKSAARDIRASVARTI
jgi:hypothetical protein